jgi:hypothetical protein
MWTQLNGHSAGESAAFIGFLPLIILTLWLFKIKKHRKVIMKWSHISLWIGGLAIVGFVFSLGPRFNWNGIYKVTPLPYLVLLKLFPPLGIIRATARWYVFVHFATSIAMVILLNQLSKLFSSARLGGIFPAFFLFAVFELYPPRVQTMAKKYIRASDQFLQVQCKRDNGPILEYPFEYRAADFTVSLFLAAKTNTLMYSTIHTCLTLSGFSSYEPPLFQQWQKDFDTNGVGEKELQILKQNHFKYVRVTLHSLTANEIVNSALYLHTNKLKKIYSDNDVMIYKINY